MRITARMGLLMIALLLSFSTMATAQNTPRISLRLPAHLVQMLPPDAFDAFEVEHGVEVVLLEQDSGIRPIQEPEAHLDDMAALARGADVVHLSQPVSPLAVRAGYLLDLDPLVQVDAGLAAAFHPGLLDSLRWDGGLWALPLSWQPIYVSYDTRAFDAVGMAYPQASWMLDDFASAASALARTDPDGAVVMSGLVPRNIDLLLHMLYGQPIYDATGELLFPRLYTPEFTALLEQWATLSQEAAFRFPEGGFAFDIEAPPPLMIDNILTPDATNSVRAAALPGGWIGAQVETLAVSSGSAYPELAFALVEYLTRSPALIDTLPGMPARRDMAQTVPAQIQALIDSTQVLPGRESVFATYLQTALQAVESGGLSAGDALIEAQANAESGLSLAAARREMPLVVEAPPPVPVIASDEIALRFGWVSASNPQLLEAPMRHLAVDFAASHPRVGHVEMDFNAGGDVAAIVESYDCFIMSSNYAPPSAALADVVLSLDPLLDADPDFDTSAPPPSLMQAVQANGQTWALPLGIRPEVLLYDPAQLAAAGLPTPPLDWSAASFEDTLRTLAQTNGGQPPLALDSNGALHLLLLVHAYGGQPFTEDGPHLSPNFSDPATLEAMRGVLGLVEAGLIYYGDAPPSAAPVFWTGSSDHAMQYTGDGERVALEAGMVNYPRTASGPVVLNYSMSAAYISAGTADPQACYDWIAAISRAPAVQQHLPANLALLDDPAYQATIPAGLLAFYQDYAALLRSSPTFTVSSIQTSIPAQISYSGLLYGMHRALFDGVELSVALNDASERVNALYACAGADMLAQGNMNTLNRDEYAHMMGCFEQHLPQS